MTGDNQASPWELDCNINIYINIQYIVFTYLFISHFILLYSRKSNDAIFCIYCVICVVYSILFQFCIIYYWITYLK